MWHCSLHGCVFRYSAAVWWLTALVNVSWLECYSIAAGACPLQAWLPRTFVYPHKASSCIAVNAIACPEPSPPGNTTMNLTSECYGGPSTCYCKVNLEDGLVLFGSVHALINSHKWHWLFDMILAGCFSSVQKSQMLIFFIFQLLLQCWCPCKLQCPIQAAGAFILSRRQ